jgi:hypothetical protein
LHERPELSIGSDHCFCGATGVRSVLGYPDTSRPSASCARRPDVHEEAPDKTGARRSRYFPDIHSASSAMAERQETLCGRSHLIPRRRDAPRLTSGMRPESGSRSRPVQPSPRHAGMPGPKYRLKHKSSRTLRQKPWEIGAPSRSTSITVLRHAHLARAVSNRLPARIRPRAITAIRDRLIR